MKPLFAAAALIALALPASAQEEAVCMDTDEMEAALLDWYGEKPVTPIDANGHMVWAAGIGASWTLISYEPNGTSCTLASGDNWSPVPGGENLMATLVLR